MTNETKKKVGRPPRVKPKKAPKGAPKKELSQRKFGLNLNQTDLKLSISGALIQSKYNGNFAAFWAELERFISGLWELPDANFITPIQDIPCL
jgi:hypothetical protein